MWRWVGGMWELIWRFGAGGRFGRFGVYGVGWSYWAQIIRWLSHRKNIDSYTEDTQECPLALYSLILRDITISPMTIPMPNPIAIRS